MTKHVALVCRLSPRPDGTYEGVDAQEGWGRDYAARHWPDVPIEVFADRGISAANGDERPEFERFRQWVRDDRIAHVWAVEQSRLERREIEWFQLAALLDEHGIDEVHTNRDGVFKVRSVLASIKAVLNADYVRELKRRIADKNDWLAAEGRPSGVRPFGYEHAEIDGVKTYAVVDEQAEVIRWAANRVLDGWSLSNVAAELDARGVAGGRGGKVTTSTVRTWLRSPSMAGYRVHRGRIVGRGNWTPILDEQTWQALAAKLGAPRAVKTVNGERQVTASMMQAGPSSRKYLLTSLVSCGVCGAPLRCYTKQISNVNKSTRPYMQCVPGAGGRGCVGIAMQPAEDHILGELWDRLDKPEFLEQIAADTHAGRRNEIVNALSAIDETERPEQAALWGAGELTTGEYRAAREALAAREQRLRDELAALPPPVLDVDVTEARQAWDYMMLGERREFLRLFIAGITLNPATKPRAHGFDPTRLAIEWREAR